MPADPLRVIVVANKTWECEPLVAVLLARDARPPQLGGFARGYDPAETPLAIDPSTGKPPELPPEADGLRVRGLLPIRPRLKCAVGADAVVEVWCVEDWMRTQRKKKTATGETIIAASSSSTFEKLRFALPRIKERAFGGKPAQLVIAFGTAGIPSPESMNGCVTIGSRVYLHDPWLGAPAAEISDQIDRFGALALDDVKKALDRPIASPRLRDTLFTVDMSIDARHAAEARFLRPPVEASSLPRILAGHGYASLGTIDVCDYDDYVWADEETLQQFDKQVRQREIGSMETTHGLIRLTWEDTPFLFASGLTDRVPLFNAEVTPRKYAQNFAAAHNAGVAVAFLLVELARLYAAGKLFA